MYRNFKQSQRVLRENLAERKNKIQEFWKRNFEQDLSEKEVTRNYHDDEEAVQEERTKKKKKEREDSTIVKLQNQLFIGFRVQHWTGLGSGTYLRPRLTNRTT